jgi:hypothetical protein
MFHSSGQLAHVVVSSPLLLTLLPCHHPLHTVSVPFIVVVKFEGDKLKAERIYWDQVGIGRT